MIVTQKIHKPNSITCRASHTPSPSLIYSAAHHVTKQLIEALVLFQVRLVVVLEQLVDVLFPVGRGAFRTVGDHLKVLQLRLQILFPLLICVRFGFRVTIFKWLSC
uniref:(northern house mosquito) hypothetical protein n=1 Tax=Culex pipiens TaxID=7175 RepID=A0A8D8HKZ4_CULPI